MAILSLALGIGANTAIFTLVAMALRETAKSLDPDLFVHTAITARHSMGTALFLPRMGALLIGLFGGLALLMTAVGLYGVVSYAVARRRREVGIRLSLGARDGDVVRLMMRGGMRLVVVGAAGGLVLAAVAGSLVERFLFGVSGADPLTFLVIPPLLLSVALLASYLPARRASRVSPMETLRAE